ncbi:hypothetical protein Q5X62_03430 [Acinetobacter baumannii]|nr:hypothetical protein [Acinetobacter baumannii]
MSTFTKEDDQNISVLGAPETFVEDGTNTLTYTSSENTGIVVIRITEDKLRLCLIDYQDSSVYGGYALGLLGIDITIIITLLTVENFKGFWIFTPELLKAIFIVSAVLILLYILKYVFLWIKNKERLKIHNLIKNIKGENN